MAEQPNPYWNRQRWLTEFPNQADRQRFAKESPMAWILEYQPTILLPGKGYLPLEPYPFQQDFLNCRDDFRIINKPRQCGISTIVAAEVAWEFDNIPGAQIMIVSKDLGAAQNFHTYVMDILRSVRLNNPDAPKIVKWNQSETKNENGSRIVSLAASREAGRSFSPTHFVFDEAAFTQYDEDIWQAASSGLSKTDGRATVISTPKGRANLFYRFFENSKHNGFTAFNYGWWDVPDYNPFYDQMIAASGAHEKKKWIEKGKEGRWYKKNRPTKTSLQWRQEFEGAFDANVGTVFSTRSLEGVFVRNYLKEKDDPTGVITEWWTKPKVEGHLYATGTDLGRKNDPTVQVTFDTSVKPAEMVEYIYIEPDSSSWETIGSTVRKRLEFWESDEAEHDGTGVGDTLSEELYGLSEPFFFTKTNKQNMIEREQHAFDYRQVKMPKIERLYREHQTYIWDDKDIVQDTVMATGLAIHSFYETEDVWTGVDNTIQLVEAVA